MAGKKDESSTLPPEIRDEPGMAERFQRGLRNLINTPPKHRVKTPEKSKELPASKKRIPKDRTRS